MKKLIYDRLEQTIYHDVLPNGLQLYVIPKPGFSKKYAFFATNYGSIDTSFVLDGKPMVSADGVAHYLEHKMFDMKDGNALQKMSATGASPNAFTSYQLTAYYVECTQAFAEILPRKAWTRSRESLGRKSKCTRIIPAPGWGKISLRPCTKTIR